MLRVVLAGGLFLLAAAASAIDSLSFTVAKDGFAGELFEPPRVTGKVGVIRLGGSEGGVPQDSAKRIASMGHPVLALGYFGTPGTPEKLDEIPLEYFDRPLAWFRDLPEMRDKAVVLMGGSKGAELALLLASRKPEIGGVVAVSPSHVVFQGIPKVFWPPRSSWTSSGDPLPFVPYDIRRGINPPNYRPMYEQSLSHPGRVAKALIPVEQINGPILLLSGERDTMWPAPDMADAITKRLREKGFSHAFEHTSFPDAGHTLSEYYPMGGDKEGNRKARLAAEEKTRAFLQRF